VSEILVWSYHPLQAVCTWWWSAGASSNFDNKKKLLAQWQGPYPVTWKVGKVDYEVDMKDKSKCFISTCLSHFMLLRQWSALQGKSVKADGMIFPFGMVSLLGLQLLVIISVNSTADCFTQVWEGPAGTTSLTKHVIIVQEGKPYRQAPYCIPQTYKETVRQELDKILQAGIIIALSITHCVNE